VLSDKPATKSLADCLTLRDALGASGCLYGLTHPYAAYPLIAEAAERVRAGQLGTVRKVLVEYTQGWLAEPIERRVQKQAIWRIDPKRAGLSSCMGDIGVHAFHLAEFVANVRTTELCADLNSIVSPQLGDDSAFCASTTARAACSSRAKSAPARRTTCGCASTAMPRASLPARTEFALDQTPEARQMIRSGRGLGCNEGAVALAVIGYLSVRQRLSRVRASSARRDNGNGSTAQAPAPAVPGIKAALRGMAFIETVVAASKSTQKWHTFPNVAD
jgi:hypothetical protein